MIGGTFYHANNPRALKVAEAFRAATGCTLSQGGYIGEPPFYFYGVKRALYSMFERIRQSGAPWLYADNGYFPRDLGGFRYYSITRNALRYAGPIEWNTRGAERLEALGVRLAPWRAFGTEIVAALQSPWWYQRHGTTWKRWSDNVTRTIRAHDQRRPIRFRFKPKESYSGHRYPPRPLDEDLANAYCVVTHSSNVALDAVVAGVPAFCQEYHPIRSLGFTDLSKINDIPRPDRASLLETLAAQQWSLEEIANGDWLHLL